MVQILSDYFGDEQSGTNKWPLTMGNIVENSDKSKVHKLSQLFSKFTGEMENVKIALLCKTEKHIQRIKGRDSS